MAAKRTMREWFKYLDDSERQFTLEEFTALMAFHTRENSRRALEEAAKTTLAVEHTEGMMGAVDEFLMRVALMHGIEYKGSAKARELMDQQRDIHRVLGRLKELEDKP